MDRQVKWMYTTFLRGWRVEKYKDEFYWRKERMTGVRVSSYYHEFAFVLRYLNERMLHLRYSNTRTYNA
jgi:hypothetical protein